MGRDGNDERTTWPDIASLLEEAQRVIHNLRRAHNYSSPTPGMETVDLIEERLTAASARYREEAGKAVAYRCEYRLDHQTICYKTDLYATCKSHGTAGPFLPLFAAPVGAMKPEEWPSSNPQESEPSRARLLAACRKVGTSIEGKWLSEIATETIERLGLNPAKLAALREAWGPPSRHITVAYQDLAAAIEGVLKEGGR